MYQTKYGCKSYTVTLFDTVTFHTVYSPTQTKAMTSTTKYTSILTEEPGRLHTM